MKLFSTNNHNNIVDLRTAVLNPLPKDKGLYLPCSIPTLSSGYLRDLKNKSFPEIALEISSHLFDGYIPDDKLVGITQRAFDFDVPVKSLSPKLAVLELFHGPTLAFKDFGARFLAELVSYFTSDEDNKTTILVATSGDTGGAVAAGFNMIPNVNVIILYPSGKISKSQEKQLTTWGSNIQAIEVLGSFDDCQSMVKQAFLDDDLTERFRFSSANSINIARLIPQSFYYFEAYKYMGEDGSKLCFCVPSGNFGNLCAGVLAYKIGFKVEKFIAATNANNAFNHYIETGSYIPKPSVTTLSNAMDVGNPSNFPRILSLLGSTWNNVKELITSYTISELETLQTIKNVHNEYDYIIDPHSSVGMAAISKDKYLNNLNYILLSTAHPAKFENIYTQHQLGIDIEIPRSLENILNKDKRSTIIENRFESLKELLMFNPSFT